MEEFGLVAVSTYIGHGPTFFRCKSSSQIDFVFLPKTLLGDVFSAGPLRMLVGELQVISTRQARDH
eukprot:6387832-Pyramimonas_sp.AAC.1